MNNTIFDIVSVCLCHRSINGALMVSIKFSDPDPDSDSADRN